MAKGGFGKYRLKDMPGPPVLQIFEAFLTPAESVLFKGMARDKRSSPARSGQV